MNLLSASSFRSASTPSYSESLPVVLPVAEKKSAPLTAITDAVVVASSKFTPSILDRAPLSKEAIKPVTLPHDDASPQLVIATGKADDLVEITKGADNRIHVMVNGKEAWSGTPREFARVRIDTGAGNDTVINRVDGAYIDTGAGDDTIHNYGSHSFINTSGLSSSFMGGNFRGPDKDTVVSHGHDNRIITGFGEDKVTTTGDYNTIQTGDDADIINSTGHHNAIDTGKGAIDGLHSAGNFNTIVSDSEMANVGVEGDNNTIRLGSGNSMLTINGDHNNAYVGWGTHVSTKGDGNVVQRPSLGGLAGLFRNR